MRALRVDKMTYAALEATLDEVAAGRATTTVPVMRMLSTSREEIGRRADLLAEHASTGLHVTVVDGESAVGGGSAPGAHGADPAGRDHRTRRTPRSRAQTPDASLIARIDDGRVVIDLRTVEPDLDATVADPHRRGGGDVVSVNRVGARGSGLREPEPRTRTSSLRNPRNPRTLVPLDGLERGGIPKLTRRIDRCPLKPGCCLARSTCSS